MISTNIGTLVFLSTEVNHSVSLIPLFSLSYLSYSLTQLALILRSSDIYQHFGQPAYFNETFFMEIVTMTQKYQDRFYDELKLWEYCPSSQIVDKNIIHYWDMANPQITHKTNLFGFVEFILGNVNLIRL